MANFCKTYIDFCNDVLEKSIDEAANEWHSKLRLYAAQIDHEGTRNLLILLSYNNPRKQLMNHTSNMDEFRFWFLQTKKLIYTEEIMAKLVALKESVLKDDWPVENDNYFIDVLPDARQLVGFTLHIWQRNLVDFIRLIESEVARYLNSNPNSKKFELYETMIIWKKDCLEALREILKIRTIYYSKVVKINLTDCKALYDQWIDCYSQTLSVLIRKTDDQLDTVNEIKAKSFYHNATE